MSFLDEESDAFEKRFEPKEPVVIRAEIEDPEEHLRMLLRLRDGGLISAQEIFEAMDIKFAENYFLQSSL